MFKDQKDLMSILFLAVIFAMWVLQGLQVIDLTEAVVGATIAVFTLIAQFFFRKSQSNGTS